MNKGVPLAVLICCIWPVVFHLAVTYGWRFIARRDWRNVDWAEFFHSANPWRKHE